MPHLPIQRFNDSTHHAATAIITLALFLGLSPVSLNATPTPSLTPQSAQSQASAIAEIVQKAMKTDHLRAVIVKVTQGDKVIMSQAFGESMNGVPATTAMHFRNGAVAFAYLGTLLMEFVDEHKVKLDDTIDRWMPTLPEANKVTLKMLANQTSGYPDFETDPKWLAAFNADPFHIWTFDERLKYAFSRPVQFDPGTNWSYSHTNFMILGEILSKIGNKPLDVLLREKVLDPMGLTNTTASQTSDIPSPVLHAFDSERRTALKIPANIPFYEESSFWNSQWGTPIGANETTNHRRHGNDRNESWQWRAVVEVQLRSHDRPALARVREKAGQLCALMRHTNKRIQLRPRHRALGIMAVAEPDARRLQRDGGVPALQEDRHRRVRNLRAGSIRLRGELPQFQ